MKLHKQSTGDPNKIGSQIIDVGPGWIRAASQDPLTAYLGRTRGRESLLERLRRV